MLSLKTETEIGTQLEQEIKSGSQSSSEGVENRKQPDRHTAREGKGAGYIYIMQDRPDRFKVGCSKTPESRHMYNLCNVSKVRKILFLHAWDICSHGAGVGSWYVVQCGCRLEMCGA